MSKDAPTAAQPGIARVGRYLMLDLLGEGAFGKVRLAVDETSGKEYAMKIMEKSHIKANELTLQVRREIAVMKAMRHPNIVNLHEVLTSSKNLYMVMDLVTGGELFDAVAAEGRLTEARTRLYFQQLVDGVHYCHTRRVYHRDLKPENLLLSGDKQTLKITDFGLSSIKAQNASSELLHTIMGSPHYIAPEIITSAAEGYDGAKVDVWASGVILYGMLAGFLPFDEPNTRALYKSIVQNPIKYPPHFSYDVIKLLRSMLQKDPNKRPTMDQVKSFTWFKVNYEPAMSSDSKQKSGDKSERRKLRHKLRKHTDRSGKKRKDKGKEQASEDVESGPSRLEQFRQNRRKRDAREPSELSVDGEDSAFSSRSSVVVEVCTNNVGEESPWNGADVAPENKQVESTEQENIDPSETEEKTKSISQPSLPPVDRSRSFSDRTDPSRSFTKPSDPSRSFTRSSDSVRVSKAFDPRRSFTRSGDSGRSGKSIDPGRSFTKISNAARSFTRSRNRQASTESATANSSLRSHAKVPPICIDKSDQQLSRGPSASSQASGVQPESCEGLDGSGMISVSSQSLSGKEDCHEKEVSGQASSVRGYETSPGDAEANNDCDNAGVSAPQEDKASTQEESSEVEPIDTMMLETPRAESKGDEGEPSSPGAFISPISVSSRVSFSTISKRAKAPPLSPEINCLFSSFESPMSQAPIRTPKAVIATPGADSCLSSVQGFEEEGASSSHVNSAIFKPAMSIFASLTQQTPKQHKASMSPSVFCPEVDADADLDGNSEWCIDSVEVFADVEGAGKECAREPDGTREPEGAREPEVAKSEEKLVSPRDLVRNVSSSLSIIDQAKPIFAPLNSDFAFQLSPSIEAETEGTSAVRKLPLAQ